MHRLFFIVLLFLSQYLVAAENDAPVDDADQQELAENGPEAIDEAQGDGSELIVAEISEPEEGEEESSVRFIPTEEISQDLGVSFPVDI